MAALRSRRKLLLVVLLIGVVGALVIARGALRPQASTTAAVTVPEAYAGTTYAFDGMACLAAKSVPVTVTGASDSELQGVRTRAVARPPDAPVTVAYPAPADAGDPLVGVRVAAGEERCFRVLVTAAVTGEKRAGPVEMRVSYGPFGLLRSTLRLTPPVTLQVTGTGTDPRARG